MSIFSYVTNRAVKNKIGEDKGRIKLFVRKGSDMAEGEYTCPECGHKGKINDPWKKPFSKRCDNCSLNIKMPKLLQQFKREKKKAKADSN